MAILTTVVAWAQFVASELWLMNSRSADSTSWVGWNLGFIFMQCCFKWLVWLRVQTLTVSFCAQLHEFPYPNSQMPVHIQFLLHLWGCHFVAALGNQSPGAAQLQNTEVVLQNSRILLGRCLMFQHRCNIFNLLFKSLVPCFCCSLLSVTDVAWSPYLMLPKYKYNHVTVFLMLQEHVYWLQCVCMGIGHVTGKHDSSNVVAQEFTIKD